MATQRPPRLISMLSAPVAINNFTAVQSAQLAVATASVSVTFTLIPSTQRVTYKITNTGASGKTAYICGSNSSNIIPASVSTTTPMPTSTLLSVSICDAIPAGAILTQDFPGGTDTISAICGGSNTTTLEISLGEGQ